MDTKKLFAKGNVKYLVILGIVLISLILLSEFWPSSKDKSVSKTEEDTYRAELENELENIISQIEGVGKTKIMITTDGSVKKIYAAEIKEQKDISSDADNDDNNKYSERSSNESKLQVIERGGVRDGILLRTEPPAVAGVLVVCKGGDSKIIRDKVIEAVSTALGILSTKIYVTKLTI